MRQPDEPVRSYDCPHCGQDLRLPPEASAERDRLRALLILAYDELMYKESRGTTGGILTRIFNTIGQVTEADVVWAREQLK